MIAMIGLTQNVLMTRADPSVLQDPNCLCQGLFSVCLVKSEWLTCRYWQMMGKALGLKLRQLIGCDSGYN